jgi:hypothetical protein
MEYNNANNWSSIFIICNYSSVGLQGTIEISGMFSNIMMLMKLKELE